MSEARASVRRPAGADAARRRRCWRGRSWRRRSARTARRARGSSCRTSCTQGAGSCRSGTARCRRSRRSSIGSRPAVGVGRRAFPMRSCACRRRSRRGWCCCWCTALGVAAGGRAGRVARRRRARRHAHVLRVGERGARRHALHRVRHAGAGRVPPLVSRDDDRRGARRVLRAPSPAAVLTKGPAGAVLPVLVIARRSWRASAASIGCAALWSWRLAGAGRARRRRLVRARVVGGRRRLPARADLPRERRPLRRARRLRACTAGARGSTMVENLATDLLPWNLVLVWAAVALVARRARGHDRALPAHLVDRDRRVLHGRVREARRLPAAALSGDRGARGPRARRRAWRACAPIRRRCARRRTCRARWWPVRPARALIARVVVIDLAVVLVGQIVRVRRAGRASLVPFARAVAARCPPDARRSSPIASLDESDLLVLAYRLGARPAARGRRRALRRRNLSARDAAPRRADRVDPLLIVRAARRSGRAARRTRAEQMCPLALGSGSDR